MAETLESLVFKPVQELAVDCKTIPERYILKCPDEAFYVDPPVIDIPVIDLNLIQSPSPSADQVLEKLRTSLSSCGCVQVIGHGMTNSLLDQVHSIGRDFFALPLEEKRKCLRTAEGSEGYGNASAHSDQIHNWSDRLYLTTSPEDQRKLKFWPQNPENFSNNLGSCRETLQEYTEKLVLLNKVVLKALSRSLNLKESCFLDQYGENTHLLTRFNYYPPCPRPDLALGIKEHSDATFITFLLPDNEVGGLQVLKDDHWFRVPTVPNALFINIGDQVEIMSNGIFKSPLHRVVTNSERERLTVAVFCTPDSSRYIEPAEALISEKSPRLYKKVNNYVRIYFENFQQGRRGIEAVKI
uniref:Fe2OG dioxygenase domain-containing protein n=1 Tax=Daucus carota subsp. sativus TaxID=79200 RepID=A0A165WWF0_DAUCS